MDYDRDRAAEMALALMVLNCEEDSLGVRAWKSFPWEVTDRLHEMGLITNPATKAKSVGVTEEGLRRARELFEKYLGLS